MAKRWFWIPTLLLLLLVGLAVRRLLRPAGLPSAGSTTALQMLALPDLAERGSIRVPGEVRQAVVSPDGTRLATVSVDLQRITEGPWLLLWSLPDGRFLHRIDLPQDMSDVAWVGNDRVMVSGSTEESRLLSVPDGRFIIRLPAFDGPGATHPERPWVAGLSHPGGAPRVQVADIATGKVIFSSPLDPHDYEVGVAWSSDGRHLATHGAKIRIWEVRGWRPLGVFSSTAVRNGACTGLPARDAQLLSRTAKGHQRSRDGRWLVRSGRMDVSSTSLELLDLATPRMARVWDCSYLALGPIAALDPGGRWLVVGAAAASGQDTLGLLTLDREGKPRRWQAHEGAVETLDVDPQGRWVATGGQDWKVKLWSAADGRLLWTFEGHQDALETVRLSGDGAFLASRAEGEDGVRIWDAATGRLSATLPTQRAEGFEHFRFHPTLPQLLVPTPKGLEVWDATTGKLLKRLDLKVAADRGIAFAPDGGAAAVMAHGRVLILDPGSLEVLGELPAPPPPQAQGDEEPYFPFDRGQLQFSKDGRQLRWMSDWSDGGDQVWGACWSVEDRTLLSHGPGVLEEKDDAFPPPRDTYSDQHSATPDGKVRADGVGYEAGC